MAKSGNIQCHYDSSKNVHDISTVSVRYRYESMTATLRSMRIDHGGTTNAHGPCTVRYGTSTIHGGSSVVKPRLSPVYTFTIFGYGAASIRHDDL